MTPLILGLLLLGCRGAEPQPPKPAPRLEPTTVEPLRTKPKLKLPPADHVPFSNPNVMNHEGGKIPSGKSSSRSRGSRGAASGEENEWQWPANATKPTERNAPLYDGNGRRIFRTSELIDDQELSRRLQQNGR